MLVLSRLPGEKISIGNDIVIVIVKIKGRHVSVGIEAPKCVKILRTEVPDRELIDERE